MNDSDTNDTDSLPVEVHQVSQDVDEEKLKQLWEKGRVAWRDVESASRWVEEIRGH
jgi:hypothetical protein